MDYNNESDILQTLTDCKYNINRYFNQFCNNCESEIRAELNEMFDVLEADGCQLISSGCDGDDLSAAIEEDQERLSDIVQNNVQIIIHNESIDLKERIEREMKRIKEATHQIELSINSNTNCELDLSKVLEELSFGFTDFANWALYLGSSFMVGYSIFTAANWWNPVGWVLGAIGAGVAIFGDSKETKAKKEFREQLHEAKSNFFDEDFQEMMTNLKSQINEQKQSIISNIDVIIKQAKTVRDSTDSLLNDLESMSNKL